MKLFFLVIFFNFIDGSAYTDLNAIRKCDGDFCIPRVIWTHWDAHKIPEDVEEMVNVSRKSLRNFTHCLLTPQNISMFLDVNSFPRGYHMIHLAGHSDYIRICLLVKYGGFYVDSTTYINCGAEFEWFFSEAMRAKLPAVGFGLQQVCTNFFGASEGSFFVKRFKQEFDIALSSNPHEYVEKTRHELHIRGHKKIYGIPKWDYLMVDLLWQKVTRGNETMIQAVLKLPTDNSNFRLIFECNFERKCMRDHLLHDPVARSYPFIKVSGFARNGKKFHIGDEGYDLNSTADDEIDHG